MAPPRYLRSLLDRLQATEAHRLQAWSATCPAHRDRHRSLWLVIPHGRRAFLYCVAGCPEARILEALGLPREALRPPAARVVATYDYRDDQGMLLFQVLRYSPKRFRERWPDSRPQEERTGGHLVLYRLSKLLAADPAELVFLVEGEKDVERLRDLGLVATTSPRGASAWPPNYARWLAGRQVIILPDNDPAGDHYARTVARSLEGIAASVRIVQLPGVPPQGRRIGLAGCRPFPREAARLRARNPGPGGGGASGGAGT